MGWEDVETRTGFNQPIRTPKWSDGTRRVLLGRLQQTEPDLVRSDQLTSVRCGMDVRQVLTAF